MELKTHIIMIDRFFSLLGTCIGSVIGFYQIDVMPFMLKVYAFEIPGELKTLLMAFLGGAMAWLGGQLCKWINSLRLKKKGK